MGIVMTSTEDFAISAVGSFANDGQIIAPRVKGERVTFNFDTWQLVNRAFEGISKHHKHAETEAVKFEVKLDEAEAVRLRDMDKLIQRLYMTPQLAQKNNWRPLVDGDRVMTCHAVITGMDADRTQVAYLDPTGVLQEGDGAEFWLKHFPTAECLTGCKVKLTVELQCIEHDTEGKVIRVIAKVHRIFLVRQMQTSVKRFSRDEIESLTAEAKRLRVDRL